MNLLASEGQLRASFLRWALVCVPAIVLLGFISGMWAQSGPDNPWFMQLVKPAAFPPPAVFGIVWTILYVALGIALALVLSARGALRRGQAVVLFAVQLLLNLAWSPVFFGAHQMTWGLVLILAILAAAVMTTLVFWRIRPLAGALLVPYLAWLVFAGYLNYAFLAANPTFDGVEVSASVERFAI